MNLIEKILRESSLNEIGDLHKGVEPKFIAQTSNFFDDTPEYEYHFNVEGKYYEVTFYEIAASLSKSANRLVYNDLKHPEWWAIAFKMLNSDYGKTTNDLKTSYKVMNSVMRTIMEFSQTYGQRHFAFSPATAKRKRLFIKYLEMLGKKYYQDNPFTLFII